MGALRRLVQPFRSFGRGLVAALPVAVLLGAACLGPLPERYPPRSGAASVTIYVVGHGWHTGIVVRRDDVPTDAWPESSRLPVTRFLEVGWGDRAFYESPDAGVSLALKAALASEASVLHVAGFDRTPAEYFPRAEIIAIELSSRGMESVAGFISRTYARDAAGSPSSWALGSILQAASTPLPAATRSSTPAIAGSPKRFGRADVLSRPSGRCPRVTSCSRPSGAGRSCSADSGLAGRTAASSPRRVAWLPRPRRESARSRRTTRGDPGRWASTA